MLKCVIWDLDNTLWNGTIDHGDMVILRDGAHETLEHCQRNGVVCSICSRNDPDVAMKTLKRLDVVDYFLYPQISWEEKSTGVKRICDDLHIRAEDILFVDDSAFERDEIRSVFPEIGLDDGSDLYAIKERIRPIHNSGEAYARIDSYRHEVMRIRDRKSFEGDNEAFLQKCNIQMIMKRAKLDDLGRYVELIERSNQLNSTAMRYTGDRILEMLSDEEYALFSIRVADRYGDYGQSGLAITRREGKRFAIELFIISCRLLGKGISQAFLAELCAEAVCHGAEELTFHYKRNVYNRQMLIFLRLNQFVCDAEEREVQTYLLNIRKTLPDRPPWVRGADIT